MGITYTKLFSSITESTIWLEPDHTRLLWITMLAMADRQGRVFGSLPGLAHRAIVPIKSAEVAIQRFLEPDEHSRSPNHEGKRIEIIEGGWRLINYGRFRELRDEEAMKEAKRKYINRIRAQEKECPVDPHVEKSGTVDRLGRSIAEASTSSEASSEADLGKKKKRIQRKKEKVVRTSTEFPDDFILTPALDAYARTHGVQDPAHTWEHFKAHHLAKGSRFTNWPQAWRTWVLSPIQKNTAPAGIKSFAKEEGTMRNAAALIRKLEAQEQAHEPKVINP